MNDPADRMLERVLVLRCQIGDAAAFTELVERYGGSLRRFVDRLLAKPALTDDVLQDIWLDVYRGIARLADAGALRAWLFRIARDRVYRTLRQKRHPAEPLADREFAVADDGVVFTTEDLAALHVEMAALPAPQREVLLLRFVEELSYEDIARVTGVPLGTIRSRLHYAKTALHTRLSKGLQS